MIQQIILQLGLEPGGLYIQEKFHSLANPIAFLLVQYVLSKY